MAYTDVQGGNPVEAIHGRTTATGAVSQVACIGVDGSDGVVTAHPTRGIRVDAAGNTVITGRVTIATAGTPAQLSVSNAVKSVCIIALPTNTQRVAIGDANVNADTNNLRGKPLEPLQEFACDVADLNLLYLDVLGDGHGITFMAVQ